MARADAPLISAAHWIRSFKEDRDLPQSLASARKTLVLIIESECWREFYWPNEIGPEIARFDSFEEFVTARPGKGGLGWTINDLRGYVRGDPVTEDAVDRVTQRKAGGDTRSQAARSTVDNVNVGRPDGNSALRALRVLREKAPELHAQVLAGELTANAAMIEGGFRKRTRTIPCDVEGAERALRRMFNPEERHALGQRLMED